MIRQYSLKADGEKRLQPNFLVKEFACKDGSDAILIADELVTLLQQLRNSFGRITISSGYRTKAYNSRIGGALHSRHMTGEAADIDTFRDGQLMNPLRVVMKAQSLGASGLGCYQYANGQSWVHIGSARTGKFWRQAAPGAQVYIDTFLPVCRKGDKSDFVGVLQEILKEQSFYSGELDDSFGPKTLAAVKKFQTARDLEVDGVCGPRTWAAIFK